MLCENCGKKEANVKYTENINGVKKEMNLCETCSKELGITNMNFNIPINFSSFFGEFLEDIGTQEFMPLFNEVNELKCNDCGNTFKDIVNTGKFGCGNCYDVFEDRIDNIIRKIQGSTNHVGRLGEVKENKIEYIEKSQDKELSKVDELKEKLKQAIKEEKYEEAATLRDEIKRLEK